jgi:hypothetical protein
VKLRCTDEGEEDMKRTLLTIAITTVIVLVLVGIGSSLIMSASFGGAAATEAPAEYYRESYGAPAGGFLDFSNVLLESPDFAPAPQTYISSDQAVTSNVTDTAQQQVERKVIKNADLVVVVKDPEESMMAISALAEEAGGYVVLSNLYESSYGPNDIPIPEANISIRIPAENLTDVLARIKKDAVDVNYENISGQDVTDQFVDLTSRLTAKQAAEKKLLEILEDASETTDVLAVYQQLQQIQSDIEVLKGQIKYINESVAMSSVSVRLIAEESSQPIEIGGWKIQGTAKESIEGLITFLQGFTRFLIRFFLNYLWRIILIVLPLYGVFVGGRAVYRRLNKTSNRGSTTTVAEYLEQDKPESGK